MAATRSGTRPTATGRVLSLLALVAALAAVLAGYGAVHAWRDTRGAAVEMAWLHDHGTRVDGTVVEEGLRRSDGSMLQYWVRGAGVSGEAFIDASRSSSQIRSLGARATVVVDPRQLPASGVPVDSLTKTFTADYLERVLPPALLTLILGILAGALFFAGRRSG